MKKYRVSPNFWVGNSVTHGHCQVLCYYIILIKIFLLDLQKVSVERAAGSRCRFHSYCFVIFQKYLNFTLMQFHGDSP